MRVCSHPVMRVGPSLQARDAMIAQAAVEGAAESALPGSKAGAWKWAIRKAMWDKMEAQNIARNPRPVHHRIPKCVCSAVVWRAGRGGGGGGAVLGWVCANGVGAFVGERGTRRTWHATCALLHHRIPKHVVTSRAVGSKALPQMPRSHARAGRDVAVHCAQATMQTKQQACSAAYHAPSRQRTWSPTTGCILLAAGLHHGPPFPQHTHTHTPRHTTPPARSFVDAEEAAARLATLPEFLSASVVKVNPDTPQKPVRLQVNARMCMSAAVLTHYAWLPLIACTAMQHL